MCYNWNINCWILALVSPFFTVYEQADFQNRKPLSLVKSKKIMFSKPQCQGHIKETDFLFEKRSLKEFQALWTPLATLRSVPTFHSFAAAVSTNRFLQGCLLSSPQKVKNLGSVHTETHFSSLSFRGVFLYLMSVFPNPHQSSFHKM